MVRLGAVHSGLRPHDHAQRVIEQVCPTALSRDGSLTRSFSGVKEAIPLIGALGLGCLFQVSLRETFTRARLTQCAVRRPSLVSRRPCRSRTWLPRRRPSVSLGPHRHLCSSHRAGTDIGYKGCSAEPSALRLGMRSSQACVRICGRPALGCTHAFWRIG